MTQCRFKCTKMGLSDRKQQRQTWVRTSVPEPWRYDMDPDLRMRTTGLRIRIRVRIGILLFSSVAFKMPTKNKISFFAYRRYINICLQRWQVILKSHKTVKSRFFLGFFLLLEGPGSVKIITDLEGPKTSNSYGSGTPVETLLSGQVCTWRIPGRGCATPWRWTRC